MKGRRIAVAVILTGVGVTAGLVLTADGAPRRPPDRFVDEIVLRGLDRGLFGLALDPAFPEKARLYVLYTFDGPVAATEPLGRRRCLALFDGGCVVSGRVSLLEPGGRETILLAGWCQQFRSHGVGDLAFGRDGALYASSGEGASYSRVDTGVRRGCGDPAREGERCARRTR